MGIITDVRVRQPANNDLVGSEFVVAGLGSGFEGHVGMRLLNPRGAVIATGGAQVSAGGIGIGDFSTTFVVPRAPRAGTRVTLQVFGDNPGAPDEGPSPGFDTREVGVFIFPDMARWLLYRVVRGDTLTGIVRDMRDFGRTTVKQIVDANPRITDPDHIEVGWKLRIPLRDHP